MKKNSDTKTISDLINSALFSESFSKEKVNLFVKYSTIFSFWEDIAGKKYSKITIPYEIKNGKIYISAKSSVVAQELQLYKDKILKKINSYSMPLGIEIKEMVFNCKNFSKITSLKTEEYIEDKPVWYNISALNKQNEKEEDIILESIRKIKFLSEEQKDILAKKAIFANRAKNIRNK